MAFVLRTVSHSAEGREIVRTRRIEGDRLTIGRSPDSDVHLTDLAVALRHATVARDGDRLRVTTEMGLTVELDGRQAAGGAIALASGGDIRIGTHLLRFVPVAPSEEDVPVGVERVTEGEAKMSRSAERLFSLSSVLPGKRPLAWAFALLVLALCVAWPIKSFHDRQQRAERFAHFQAGEPAAQLQLLSRQAVRIGTRHRLRLVPPRRARPCRPVPPRPRQAGPHPLGPFPARREAGVQPAPRPLHRLPLRA
jgi:hypothetical protein